MRRTGNRCEKSVGKCKTSSEQIEMGESKILDPPLNKIARVIPIPRERKLSIPCDKLSAGSNKVKQCRFLLIAPSISALENLKKTCRICFFQDLFLFLQNSYIKDWSSISTWFFSLSSEVIQKVPIFLSVIFYRYRTLLPHLHKKRPSKGFCITDTTQTNPSVKVTKSCHKWSLDS